VNYAVKSSYLLSFLESVPEVAAKLKDAHSKDRKFEDVEMLAPRRHPLRLMLPPPGRVRVGCPARYVFAEAG